jgi:hypothetical protein
MSKKQGKSCDNLSKPKKSHNMLNLNGNMKFLGLLKGSMSLVKVGQIYGKNESSIYNI